MCTALTTPRLTTAIPLSMIQEVIKSLLIAPHEVHQQIVNCLMLQLLKNDVLLPVSLPTQTYDITNTHAPSRATHALTRAMRLPTRPPHMCQTRHTNTPRAPPMAMTGRVLMYMRPA
jgi:hypothetical protein